MTNKAGLAKKRRGKYGREQHAEPDTDGLKRCHLKLDMLRDFG